MSNLKVIFQLRYDDLTNWIENNPTLETGEIAIAYVENEENLQQSVILMKVGPGSFNTLPWSSALAADVYEWAKKNENEHLSWLDDLLNSSTFSAITDLRTNKVERSELADYLTKEEYIKSESGGTIDLSHYLTQSVANTLYAPINILESVYPVGAIYLSMSDINPNVLFGFGTWTKIEDKFLLGASTKYPVGTIGGEEEHTLTELEMPAHDHEFDRHQLWRNETIPPSTSTQGEGYGVSNKTLPIYTDSTIATGAGEAHNNMPPYLAIYMWQRVA